MLVYTELEHSRAASQRAKLSQVRQFAWKFDETNVRYIGNLTVAIMLRD